MPKVSPEPLDPLLHSAAAALSPAEKERVDGYHTLLCGRLTTLELLRLTETLLYTLAGDPPESAQGTVGARALALLRAETAPAPGEPGPAAGGPAAGLLLAGGLVRACSVLYAAQKAKGESDVPTDVPTEPPAGEAAPPRTG